MFSDKGIKVYIHCGGGLGDVIQNYFANPQYHWLQMMKECPNEFPASDNVASIWFRRLEDFKRYHRDASIIVKAKCHNFAVKEFFEYHPCIERVDLIEYSNDDPEWYMREYDGYKNIHLLNDDNFDNNSYLEYIPSYPKVYMNYSEEQEKRFIDFITASNYIVLHPFAGAKNREVLDQDQYDKLIDELVKFGYNVVIVGGSYKRNMVNNKSLKLEIYDRDDDEYVVNLVNRATVRFAVNLVLFSKGFIGTHSCMFLPASFARKRSICFLPELTDGNEYWSDIIKANNNPTCWGLNQDFCKWFVIKDGKLSDEIINEIIDWFVFGGEI